MTAFKFTAAIGLAAATLLLAGVLIAIVPAPAPDFATVRAQWVASDADLVDRHGEVLDSRRMNFGVRRLAWEPLADISPALLAAVVDGEDRRFYRHGGIDWVGVIGAVQDSFFAGQRRGASTITMQLATLLRAQRLQGAQRVPRHGLDAWLRKLDQIRLARGIESRWSKLQILEAYLNLLEFRGELQGIGAAARVLAGKSSSGLSMPESLVLAALLPDPGAAQHRLVGRACQRAASRRLTVSCADIEAAASELFTHAAEPLPDASLAPQLSAALLRHAGERVQTTLDANIQRLARDTLRDRLSELSAHNVRDGAVLVVDNASGQVLAYVGSAGPHSSAGQVDGVRAHRQAGSTLKPFLYEMTLERRYLTAASLLEDSPINLQTAAGTYIPQDYDHDFKGLVTVRTALASSLNVPAVRTLVLVGVEAYRERLHRLGYERIAEDGEYYGFSLALGSAEVSLWEQAQSYRTLARGGEFSPISVLPSHSQAADRRLLPAAPTYIVADILSDHVARALTFGLDNHLNTPFWSAAKTGTSKDMRDNWCIGFSRRFTVAVWVGNFEGDAMHDVSGVTGAAPVWHDVMIGLHRNSASVPPPPPPGVIAAATRFTPAVEPARREWYLTGTQSENVVALARESRWARITSPADGMIIALDPDIPPQAQRVRITAQGVQPEMRIRLNDAVLGRAAHDISWTPAAGAQQLALEDADGHTLDRISFTVR
jgi:penicillin-binding protein 1C